MRHLTCFLLLLFSQSLFSQPSYLLHQSYAQKFFYFDSLRSINYPLSDSGRGEEIRRLANWAKDNHDAELSYEFSLFSFYKTLILSYNKQNITIENGLRDLLGTVSKSKSYYVLADVNEFLAWYYSNINTKHSMALEYYIRSYQIYSKFTAAEFPGKQEYLYSLGSMYYLYEDFDNGIKYLKEALNSNYPTVKWYFPINNTIGLAFLKKNEYDSADVYFKKIYDAAVKENNVVWISISTGNIGNIYFQQGRFDEAIPMLKKDVELSYAKNMIKNGASSSYYLAVIYRKRGNNKDALQLLLDALQSAETRSFWPDYTLAAHLYGELHYVYKALGNNEKSILYADSALNAKDSLAVQNNILSLTKMQERIDFSKNELEVSKLNDQEKIQELISLFLTACVIGLCFIAILLVNRQRNRNKILLHEKRILEAERDNAARQLHIFTQHIQEKSALVEQFSNEIERYKKAEQHGADNETLEQLHQATILTDEQWEEFRALFEKVHKGFFGRVKEKMPDLTPAEIRFVALSKLKLGPKEMASMLGISANSIRNYRLRLRRKLGLNEDASIEDIADAI